MQITITVTGEEADFLERMIAQDRRMAAKVSTYEDAVNECIRIAMYDEGEAYAQEEGVI